MKLFSNRRRPMHLGPFPIERLRRTTDSAAPVAPGADESRGDPDSPLADIARRYRQLFLAADTVPVAEHRVSGSDDEAVMANELKATGYFLDATMVGVCRVLGPVEQSAVVILLENARQRASGGGAMTWGAGAATECAGLRAVEIAVVLAGYVRQLGYSATVHATGQSRFDLSALAAAAGLIEVRNGHGHAPFVGTTFALAAVTTALPLRSDRPLSQTAVSRGLAFLPYWCGWAGTTSGLGRWRARRREPHMGAYPMERIRRRDEPTTLIFEDEVPRVPKRASFFNRALHGDLGEKTKRERTRFAMKHPLAHAMSPLLRALVPLQQGPPGPDRSRETRGPDANSRAVKSLAHFLGADLVGICSAEPYTWYSHDADGTRIEPRHRYAVVLLLDQGHDTMDAASGDDWISGSQSMRAYLRGAEIAGVIAAWLRAMGYPARSHTNLDSEVLQLPLLVLAGLGELSRIGEVVLNPFLGPRTKSVVVTTDMPLVVDRPIDFGLQSFCDQCRKCARECPCNAISYKPKVVFNGYEMWKPDVERCTRYRVTNPKGSSCGRCTKVCPFSNEGLLTHRFFLWTAIHLPFTRRWLARLDDLVGHGGRNAVKKWWRDLERGTDGTVHTPARTNARDLDLVRLSSRATTQGLAMYPADAMPPPDHAEPMPLDRARALETEAQLETPAQAQARRRSGGALPAHATPGPPDGVR